ncbi:MAG: hypothetical protein OEZ24_04495 [Candidatus Bathyarchaeota archaeon]|nr:hypothetical protein [Candidatus Bathyarchaeota archaeon]
MTNDDDEDAKQSKRKSVDDSRHLSLKDYVALVIAMLTTTLLPALLFIVVLVAIVMILLLV